MWKTGLVYLDDIIIFSKDAEQHFSDLDMKLSELHEAKTNEVTKLFIS